MKRATKWWITYYSPGSFTANYRHVDLPGYVLPTRVEWPEDAYAFTLHEQAILTDDDGETFNGKAQQLGPIYYHPDSQVQTLEEVSVDPRRTTILLDNMRSNKWPAIIWTRWGNWPQVYDPARAMVLSKPEGS